MRVAILSYGGIVQSITLPSRTGRPTDVVLGFKTLRDYVAEDSPPVTANGGPYFGETVGRYANRIAKGTFTLAGHTYTLPINNGVNSLHGGLVGFGNHVWAAHAVRSRGAAGVQLKLLSPNGDDGANVGCSCAGYPGTLTVYVTFTLNNASQLRIHYRATVAGQATVLNLTNHSYFNLGGEASGPVYSQLVQIRCEPNTPTDSTQIPTGAIVPVAGTPFDFTRLQTIGSRITQANQQLLIAQGYDHNWVLNKTGPRLGGLGLAARAWDKNTGIKLTVWTDQPGDAVLLGQLPQWHAGGHQRPHLPAELGLHVRDPALPELAQRPGIPQHRPAARAGVQLGQRVPIQPALSSRPRCECHGAGTRTAAAPPRAPFGTLGTGSAMPGGAMCARS